MKTPSQVLAFLLAGTACALSAHHAKAQLYYYEPFDYKEGALDSQNGGKGFSGPWEVQKDGRFNVEPGSLEFPGVPVSGNKAFLTPTGGSRAAVTRELGRTFHEGTVYVSLLMKYREGERFFGFSLQDDLQEKLTILKNTRGKTWNVFGLAEGTPTNAASSVSANPDEVCFFVLRVDFQVGGPVEASLYINPESGGDEPAQVAVTCRVDAFQFDRIALRAGYDEDGASTSSGWYDEIRIGSTWKDVTGAAQPVVSDLPWSPAPAPKKAAAALPPAPMPDRKELAMSLEPPVINTHPGPDYDAGRMHTLTTGIAGTPGGRLWAAWFSEDSPRAYMMAATSDDRGETWTPPRLVIHPTPGPTMSRRILVGNVWTDPKGRLWLFFDQSMGFFDGRGGVWSSVCKNPDAEDPQWSPPTRIWHGASLSLPTILSTGEWLYPISLWDTDLIFSKKHRSNDIANPYPELDDMRMAHVFGSRDEGRTWERLGGVRFPKPLFDEHVVIEKKDKSLWMLARTGTGYAWESFSRDGGRTWDPPRQSAIRQPGSRFFVTRLQSGNLLLVKNGRKVDTVPESTPDRPHNRSDLTAFVSRDDGATWEGGLVLDDRFVSYPSGFQAADGTIFISYDLSRNADAEILLARFTEEDVLAGEFKSPQSKSRMLINKAPGRLPKQK